MAQFARPDSNVTQIGFTGGFAEIDEATADDADFAVTPDNTLGQLEVGLTNPTDPAVSTGHVLRYRLAKADTGVPPSTSGNTQLGTVSLYQGTTLIAADAERTLGAWTTYSLTLSGAQADAITDYTDLRIRFDSPASGGGPGGNRRGGAISWAELEVPNAAADTALAGSSAGTSTAAGVLSTQIALAGSSAGVGTAAASLATGITLAGAAAGAATATAALTTQITLAGASAGSSSAVGAMSSLVGTSAGTSGASASLTTAIALTGASAAGSGASGVLTTAIPLVGSAAGLGAAAGGLTTSIRLAGTAAGGSTASGIMATAETTLAGSAAGASSAAASLTTAILLVGSSAGAASATAAFEEAALVARDGPPVGLSAGMSYAPGFSNQGRSAFERSGDPFEWGP